nr:immunoglobulin light chain junction region [Macaca mulatta]
DYYCCSCRGGNVFF